MNDKGKNTKKTTGSAPKTQKSTERKSKKVPATVAAADASTTTTPEAGTTTATENTEASDKPLATGNETAVDSAVDTTTTAAGDTAPVINNETEQTTMETQTTEQTQNEQTQPVTGTTVKEALDPNPVTLKLDAKERSTIMVVYLAQGRPGSVRFSKTLFPDMNPPAEITLPGNVFAQIRTPRAAETKEQRKARLAAKPKPTAAEKLARLEKKLEKLRAAAAATSAPQGEQAAQPQGEPAGVGA